jgi:hypothetical protein
MLITVHDIHFLAIPNPVLCTIGMTSLLDAWIEKTRLIIRWVDANEAENCLELRLESEFLLQSLAAFQLWNPVQMLQKCFSEMGF